MRSADTESTQFSLFCTTAERRLAQTYAEGLAKYGADNWTKGMPIVDILNHVKAHINAFLTRGGDEDDLAHAAWGLFAAMHFESNCTCHHRREYIASMDELYSRSQE